MRKLRVLLVASALLLVWGTVFTPTMAFAKGLNQSAWVLVCREVGQSSLVWDVSPPAPNSLTIARDDDCAGAIGKILNNRCSLQHVIAPDDASQPMALAYVFTCVNAPL